MHLRIPVESSVFLSTNNRDLGYLIILIMTQKYKYERLLWNLDITKQDLVFFHSFFSLRILLLVLMKSDP